MNGAVTPEDIQAQVYGTDDVTVTKKKKQKTNDVNELDAIALGSDETQRFEALLQKWVPNKAIWPQLRALQSPAELLTPQQLPFQERTFICYRTPTGLGGAIDSIMLPYYGSILTVVLTTVSALAAVTKNVLTKDGAQYRYKSDLQYPLLVDLALLTPLVLGHYVMLLLHEFPCRVFLYHRLWERKIVVDYKQRSWTHRAVLGKLVVLLLCTALYLWYGYVEVRAPLSFYFVEIQAFATFGWVIYSNVSVDKYLVPMNKALHHANATAAMVASGATDCLNANGVHVLASAMAQMRVVPESRIKYDIFALQRCLYELNKQVTSPQDLERADAETRRASDFKNKRVEQEIAWLKILATWIGSLGHSKTTMRARVGFFRRDMYALWFLSDRELYDDELWHTRGSFASAPNKAGLLSGWLQSSVSAIGLSLLGIVFGWYHL